MEEMCLSGRHVRTAENHPRNGQRPGRCGLCDIERTATPERREMILRWQAAQQDKTRRNAFNSGRPWDPEDDAMVLKLRDAGVSQPEIAMIMNRTFQAVRKRVGILINS